MADKLYNNLDELIEAIWDRMKEVPLVHVKEDATLQRLMALWNAYYSAFEEAKQYGWVGVGCITFAENRLRSLQQMPMIHEADYHKFDEYGNYGENNPPAGGIE